jgi:diguanylate cyclase (GGDEF)-like protein
MEHLGMQTTKENSVTRGASRNETSVTAPKGVAKILVVEDSRVFARAITNEIESRTNFDVCLARDMKSAQEILAEQSDSIDLAILDYVLPDAPDGEVIDLVSASGIPSIVFSGEYSEDLRDRLFEKDIVDYVVKDSPSCIEHVVSLLHRLYQNKFIKILVADDSSTTRKLLLSLLARYQFQVIVAKDGQEALEAFKAAPDIQLVITDNTMPKMDEFDLVLELRKLRSKSELPIVGMSSTGNPLMSAKFIKYGANDFVTKPFIPEEFSSRIFQQLELMEAHNALQEIISRDFLTGLNTRRSFFEKGEPIVDEARGEGLMVTVAMLDIDHFKAVNDTYGHGAGDGVLKTIGAIIADQFGDDVLAGRLGGEEFCLLSTKYSREEAERALKKLCQTIAAQKIDTGEETLSITISIGVDHSKHGNLDMAISKADGALYRVKESGRNNVLLTDPEFIDPTP